MWALKAFVLGSLAFALVGYAVAAALAVAAQAGDSAIEVGPLLLVSVTLEGTTRVTTFGLGILVLALSGGAANLIAAQLIRRRTRRGPIA